MNPEEVSLVCMGYALQYPTEEDTLCAEYIAKKLERKESDFSAIKEIIRETSGKRFFIPEKQFFAPQNDFDLCLKPGIFDFVLKAEKENDYLTLRRIDVKP
jgi:2-phosphosulfolactate phosphatase